MSKIRSVALFALLLLTSCTDNSHDGLYVANQSVAGIINVWILKGNELTIYTLGTLEVRPCRQYSDRLEVDGKSYLFDDQGDILLVYDEARNRNYRMRYISERTDYSFSELNKMVDEAYDMERVGVNGKDAPAGPPN